MAADAPLGPAARVLAEATRRNAALGHENLGALSESHGFLAQRPPEHDLPAPHDAWVAAVDELPDLCRTLRVRQRLDQLPLLDASAKALDDRHLLRAASVLGLLAHAYNNVPMRPPERLPEPLVRPWLQTAERLGRPAFTLSNSDYIFDNWRLVDPRAVDPMRVENLRLLNPIWDHPEMETFILVLVELLAQSAPLVGASVRAQQACLSDDDESLKRELALMSETVRRLTRESMPKISANARSGRRRVDPVLWTKLFAMLPLPVRGAGEGVRNASGAETPYFHLLDVVVGRLLYETQLGHEAMQFRGTHPPHWRSFIAAVAEHPIADHVRARGDGELAGLFAELAEAYHGRHGLLAAHRLKAFAYMEAAFKTGRSSTVTGFSGLFEDRAWETVDASFDAARLERVRSAPPTRRLARVERVEELCPGVQRVTLDVRGLGLVCEPGDRCELVPENEPGAVARTLEAMGASGDERVELTPEWMDALPFRPGRTPAPQATLRDVLRFGELRSVPKDAAAVCQLVAPLEPRSYSVSSISDGQIETTVDLCHARPGTQIPVSIVSPAGFAVPTEASVPIVMVAEGIGVAPFAAFLERRARTPGTRNLLLAGAASADLLPHRERILGHAARGEAEVHLAFSRDGSRPRRIADVLGEPAWTERLRELVRSRARIYVCGRADFVRAVFAALAGALAEPGRDGAELVADMIVQHRYMQEVLPGDTREGGALVDASELALHTGGADGVWAAIDGRVYDLTAFAEYHPGGQKLIQSFAGMDATRSYRIVEHDRDPAVEALLSMFEIGTMRRLAFGSERLESLFRRWARGLYLLVEIENAHRLDTSIQAELPPTPYRLQFAIEAHGRFLGQTLPIVCRCFDRLSEATTGTDGEFAGVPTGRAARERCEELERTLERDGATTELEARLSDLLAADAAYLASAKSLLASGVRAFEMHEADVLTHGREALLAALRALPSLTRDHLIAVA